jgi:hypothetical protein
MWATADNVVATFSPIRPKEPAGRAFVTEPDLEQTRARSLSRRWIKYAITLFLLFAVIVTGTTAFHSRNAWWEKYLSFIHKPT